ncbi:MULTISPECIES: low affinity iron permease family protein [Niastella]|uniref:Low affinity iron permease family protein n=1 Tax=Niastella soli TaxID=2821487 RepID=A0ABS3YN41_9BACT|nr:low affinity iron permease family protein [Niastella soli]MBO9199295.1 low affinity iron permease family protein [Niastella soli]
MPRTRKKNILSMLFQKMSNKVTKVTGSPVAFMIALSIVIIWAVTGPIFGYSDTWQLVINTGTTIVTFLMVFIIQQSQNKDTVAIHLKLNELIASHERASNRLVDIEDLTDEELQRIKEFYITISELAEKENGVNISHSLNEAKNLHKLKQQQKTGK